MRLYVTHFSPFARMARVVRSEKCLKGRVTEATALTRVPNSSYYKINPSGRVPYLVSEDGVGIEGSQQVCFYLDQLDGSPTLETPEGKAGMAHRRLEEYARSLMEGVSVWVRELRRAPEDRSEAVIEHERQRLGRLADFWEIEIDHPIMRGDLNMPQLTLACGLLLEEWYSGLEWRKGRPHLATWTDAYAGRKSFIESRPPEKLNPSRV